MFANIIVKDTSVLDTTLHCRGRFTVMHAFMSINESH